MEDACKSTECGDECVWLPGRFGGPEFTGGRGAAGMSLLIVCEDRRMSF